MRILITLLSIFCFLGPVVGQTAKELKGLNHFSIESYKLVRSDAQNFFFSPFGVYKTLGLLSDGASGQTKVEIDSLLGLHKRLSFDDISPKLLDMVYRDSGKGKLIAANGVWIDNDISLHKDFQKEHFGKINLPVDMSDAKYVANQVNDWANEKTDGTISNVISEKEITDATKLLICNSLYMNLNWTHEFDPDNTYREPFHSSESQSDTLKFMNDFGYFDYAYSKDFHFVKKPLENQYQSFCWIIPKKGMSLEEVEDQLTEKKLSQLRKNTYKQRMYLKVPKMTLEQSVDMKPILQEMGAESMFEQDADFSNMTADSIFVGAISQKSKIDVNEEKIVAVSITLVRGLVGSAPGMPNPDEPIEVYADVPFMFMIIDQKTNGIFFMGRYVVPTKEDLQKSNEEYEVIRYH